MAAKKPTTTREKPRTEEVAQPAGNAGALATATPATAEPKGLRLRLPYPRTYFADRVDGKGNLRHPISAWKLYIDTVWPAAQSVEAVCMAVDYCDYRGLDPVKRMVHIVPIWSKDGGGRDAKGEPIGGMVETVWPGIAEIRTTAARTGAYAGKDASIFGDPIKETFVEKDSRNDAVKEEMIFEFPEWCQITVYRMVQGTRCAFVGPKVYWKESYATKSRWSPIPNEMWADRKHGQLEKCAEAAALRAAFPEELGGEYAAEEVHRVTFEATPFRILPQIPLKPGEVKPPASTGTNEFSRDPAPPAGNVASDKGGDPRPEPEDTKPKPEATKPADEEAAKKAAVEKEAKDKAEREAKEKAAAEAKDELDGILKRGLGKLKAVTKMGAWADLCEEIEQDLPPESQHLKDWRAEADQKKAEIVAASKKPK